MTDSCNLDNHDEIMWLVKEVLLPPIEKKSLAPTYEVNYLDK